MSERVLKPLTGGQMTYPTYPPHDLPPFAEFTPGATRCGQRLTLPAKGLTVRCLLVEHAGPHHYTFAIHRQPYEDAPGGACSKATHAMGVR